jgi:hypothetical protein
MREFSGDQHVGEHGLLLLRIANRGLLYYKCFKVTSQRSDGNLVCYTSPKITPASQLCNWHIKESILCDQKLLFRV